MRKQAVSDGKADVMRKIPVLIVVISLLVCICAGEALALEKVYLKDGRIIEGRLVSVTSKEVKFLYKKGTIESELTFRISEVERITRVADDGSETPLDYMKEGAARKPEKENTDAPDTPDATGPEKADKPKPTPGDVSDENAAEFEKRKKAALARAAEAYVELALWCRDNGRPGQAMEYFRKALDLDDECEAAAKGLGLVRYEGEWVTEMEKARLEREAAARKALEEQLTAQGFVNLAGVWVKPEFKKLVHDSSTNKRYKYLLVLHQFMETKSIETGEFLKFDNLTKYVWSFLAPYEQNRICPGMAGKIFPDPEADTTPEDKPDEKK